MRNGILNAQIPHDLLPVKTAFSETIKQKDDTRQKCYNDAEPILSIEEYRSILADSSSSDHQIRKRVQYLEAFCRNVIRLELENYAPKHRTNK